MKSATSIDQARRMESQYRPARHADAVLGHCTQHERAGRQAWRVDHDAVTRFAQVIEQLDEVTDLAAPTAKNADLCRCGRRAQDYRKRDCGQSDSHTGAPS
jgi:hypothetical protein